MSSRRVVGIVAILGAFAFLPFATWLTPEVKLPEATANPLAAEEPALAAPRPLGSAYWPQWRGPLGNGVAPEARPPWVRFHFAPQYLAVFSGFFCLIVVGFSFRRHRLWGAAPSGPGVAALVDAHGF